MDVKLLLENLVMFHSSHILLPQTLCIFFFVGEIKTNNLDI